jgi:hypothetical protein
VLKHRAIFTMISRNAMNKPDRQEGGPRPVRFVSFVFLAVPNEAMAVAQFEPRMDTDGHGWT